MLLSFQKANDKIRLNSLDGPLGKKSNSNIYFYSTPGLPEKPINLIIKKGKLEELSTQRFIITPNDLKKIK